MKLLIATGVYSPESGGPATYSKLLEHELPKRGIQVAVLPFSSVRHLPKLIRHIAYFFKILFTSANVIYALDPVSVGLPAALASMLRGKKFLLRVAGDYAWEQGQVRFGVKDSLDNFQTKKYGFRVEFLRNVQRFVARHASKVIVPSRYMKTIVSDWGVEPIVIYSSIEFPVPTKAPERPEGFLVVSIGRNVPWKGFESLKSVVARESSWKLFLGHNLPRAEAMGWIQAADVFVLNSTYEGLSHLLVETMSLGTPVIATSVGGNPELIEDGKEGLLIPPQNDEALYGALKQIEQYPEAAKERAVAARMRSEEFSIDKTIGKLIELL